MISDQMREALLRNKGSDGRFAPTIPTVVCLFCEVSFRPKRNDRTSYCSRECYLTRKSMVAQLLRPVCVAVQMRPKPKGDCRHCEQRFIRHRFDMGYCGLFCREQANEAKRKSEESRARRKETDRRSGAKAARRSARKAKVRGVQVEAVNPLVVLDRDGWVCQLCWKPTPRRLRGSYDSRAPEVDHIVPIALGGEHSYRNTQCVCRSCNLSKGARPLGQQRLFG